MTFNYSPADRDKIVSAITTLRSMEDYSPDMCLIIERLAEQDIFATLKANRVTKELIGKAHDVKSFEANSEVRVGSPKIPANYSDDDIDSLAFWIQSLEDSVNELRLELSSKQDRRKWWFS